MQLRVVRSPYPVAETMDRLAAVLARRAVSVFARVDHAGGARAAGLELADEELLIFGDPRAGTLLMQGDPEVGYELPLRLLAWDAAGQTLVGYRSPSELAERYTLSEHAQLLERMDALLGEIVAEATSS
jgi:beta-galactosidase